MMARQQIGGLRVLAHIGEGAASHLFAVQDMKSKQVYALKRVERHGEKDQRFIEQVEIEYAIGSKLEHPNVRSVFKLRRHRRLLKVHTVDLLMELVDGQPLDQRPADDLPTTVAIFLQVARGLAHMHGRGFVHADIKPHNVLVDEHRHVKIIDLGQACPIGTVKKRIQGTPGFMAPEQAHRQTITPKTDIYNLGATMYCRLVGEQIPTALAARPEENSLFSGALDADQVELPVPPHEREPSIHPLLSKQIMDCIQVRPDDRPDSMELVSNRLELLVEVLRKSDRSSVAAEGGESVS